MGEKSTDYVRLFESQAGMPFLITSIALKHYEPLKAIAVMRDNTWTTYLPKEMQAETLNAGVELFSSKELFEIYVKEFDEYKQRSNAYFAEIIAKQEISEDEIATFFGLIAEFWKYYSKTEFFYVDEAYKQSKEDTQIADYCCVW